MTYSIGKTIRRLRKERGFTQEELVEQLNITAQAISRWENNITSPDISTLPILANIFDVTVDYLLDVNILKNEEDTEECINDTGENIQGKSSKHGQSG